jgi:hypothetical protein
VDRVASDRRDRSASRLHDSPDERDVFLLDLAIVELPRQLEVRGVVLRHDHHARRSAIESMDDPGRRSPPIAAEIGQVMQQRIDQRARRMSRARMHDHPGRLVQHGDVASW